MLLKIVKSNTWAKSAACLSTSWITRKVKICSVRVSSLLVWWRHNLSIYSDMVSCCIENGVTPYSLLIWALLEWIWLTLLVVTEILGRLLVDARLDEEWTSGSSTFFSSMKKNYWCSNGRMYMRCHNCFSIPLYNFFTPLHIKDMRFSNLVFSRLESLHFLTCRQNVGAGVQYFRVQFYYFQTQKRASCILFCFPG